MKLEFSESKYGANISLIPETAAEVAQLLRFTKNAKEEKPGISMSFVTDSPYCSIWMKKVNEKVQSNYITPKS